MGAPAGDRSAAPGAPNEINLATALHRRQVHVLHADMSETHSLADLDLNLLKALDALLQHAHVSRAAAALGLTQSAASRTLARLRALFEDDLLVRTGRGMARTPRAEALQPQVAHVLAEVGRLLSVGQVFEPATARRVFRLSSADYFNLVALPTAVATLRAEAPGVDLEVSAEMRLTEALEAGRVDVVLAPTGSVMGSELMQMSLFAEDFVVLLRAGHPALSATWDLAAYAALDHILVAPRGSRGGPVDDRLAARGLQRRVAVLTGSFASAPPLVAATDLVVTLPRRTATLAVNGALVTRPLPMPPLRFVTAAFWHVRNHTDAGHRWFRELLKRTAPPSAPVDPDAEVVHDAWRG